MNRYLGVDLHRNCFTVCTLGADGASELRKWSIHALGDFAQEVQATDAVAGLDAALKGLAFRIIR